MYVLCSGQQLEKKVELSYNKGDQRNPKCFGKISKGRESEDKYVKQHWGWSPNSSVVILSQRSKYTS